jgi:hypothetical protein
VSSTQPKPRAELYAPLTDELEEVLRWAQADAAGGGMELKARVAWRLGSVFVKRFAADRGLRAWDRRSAAVRTARRHARMAPEIAPEPLLATERDAHGVSWFAAHFIDGPWVMDAWSTDPLARERLADFMALMHARGAYHGDLHAANLIWDGRRWWLVDLDGLRGGLQRLIAPSIVRDQWVRLHAGFGLDAAFEQVYARYCELTGRARGAAASWRKIDALAHVEHRSRLERWRASQAAP